MISETFPDFDAYVKQVHDRERQQDADMRAGILCGTRMGYRYVGPPPILTSERTLFSWWLSAIECRIQGRAATWLRRLDAPRVPPSTLDTLTALVASGTVDPDSARRLFAGIQEPST